MLVVLLHTFSTFTLEARADKSDGLHLTAAGYEPIHDRLTEVILAKWPEMDPETMRMPTPQ